MSLNQKNTHLEVVRFWEEKNTKNLRTEQIVKVFCSAIQSIERRCLITLSSVTVQVVLDRIIHQGIEKFPILIEVVIETEGLNLKNFNQKKDHYDLKEINNALKYLLIEFLTVMGNITSEVLTAPLHKELMEVTSESALNVLEVQNLRLSKEKKRGEK